jgi:transposase
MAKKLSHKELLSNLKGLTVRDVVPAELGWVVEAEGSSSALCPDCGVTSHSRHGRYRRKLRDLPMQAALTSEMLTETSMFLPPFRTRTVSK